MARSTGAFIGSRARPSEQAAAPQRICRLVTRAILYDASGHDQEADLSSLDPLNLGSEQLLWVDFSGTDASDLTQLPPELQGSVGKVADLGPLEISQDSYRFAIPVHERERSYLAFVVGKSWLLTFSEGRPDFFDDFLKSDRGETLNGRLTATGLMAALLLRHYNAFRSEVATVDTSIDKLDETILRSREKRAPAGHPGRAQTASSRPSIRLE